MDEVFQFARQLQADGHLAEAEKCYRRLLEDDPESVKVLNNLGTVLDHQNKLGDAFTILTQARDKDPESALVRYNLAQVLYRQERLAPAAEQFEEALRIDPQMCDARLNLAIVRWRLDDLTGAEAALRENIEIDPTHAVSHSRLGFLLFDLGRMQEALECHRDAIALCPDDAEEYFYSGRALSSMYRFAEAADAYATSLGIEPGVRNVHEHRVRALRSAERHDDLEAAFDDWLRALPDDPVALHLRAAFDGDGAPARASDDYVRQEFDGFADDYQETLARLQYRAPALLQNAVAATLGEGQSRLRVVDAGCGTGLCGGWLSAYSRELIGVDLSPGMLTKAREQDDYDDLVEAELTQYLANKQDDLDLIVAADTLIYFGDLAALMHAAAGALIAGGLFAFTVERINDSAQAGYKLQPHGRYAHSEDYVRGCLSDAGLDVLDVATDVVRNEGGLPVQALVVTAQSPKSQS